jgi:smad nuclear-interacting protein 1
VRASTFVCVKRSKLNQSFLGSCFRLYIHLDVLHISRQSCYLMGRDRAVADIPIDHPSISKQHAVIQFRNIRERNEYGDEKQSIK